RHLVIDFYRQRHQNIVSFDEEIGDTLTDSQQISVYDRMEIISDIKQVNQVIKQLPDQYREVIILRYIEELSVKETAKIIDRSEGATRVLLHRALNALKKLIGNRPTNR
ncbi:MAG: RNA polymerase sigma factor, partial [Candidatus Aenigmarchaeota archaeon]|nr:RNA polymerase sigma factor [Candidatus Aenigmarchaeota archaeon]